MQTTAAAPHYPSTLAATPAGRIALGLAATLVIAAAAHIAVPVPFSPVPFTLQPLAVLAIGLFFAPAESLLILLAYLAEGLCGLPVFTPSGPGGAAQLLGFTGGFLMAYPLVAALAGALVRRLARILPGFFAASLAGVAAIALLFLSGSSWFFHLTHAPFSVVWLDTLGPYLPFEAVKVLLAASLYAGFAARWSRNSQPPAASN